MSYLIQIPRRGPQPPPRGALTEPFPRLALAASADTGLACVFHTFLQGLRLLALLGGLVAGFGPLHGAVQGGDPSPAQGEFEFREPARRVYRVTLPQRDRLDAASAPADWLDAQPTTGSAARVQLGRRILIQVEPWVVLGPLIDGRPIRAARDLGEQTHILEADDVPTALREAQDLAIQPGVLVCRPVLRRLSRKNGVYAPAPDDPYFARTWHLENRNQTSGAAIGADLNVRGAWSTSRGAGVLVAMGDDGVEVTHPDLRDWAR